MPFPLPSVTAPTLKTYEFSFKGFTFGGDTSWGVLSVTGLDVPQIRNGDKGRALDQGQLIGLDLFGGRDVTFDLWVYSTGTSLQAALRKLAAVTDVGGVTESPLWVKLPTTPLLVCMARVRKRTVKVDTDYAAGKVAKPSVQFHCTDPRFYTSPTTSTRITVGGGTVKGVKFPITFPVSFGGGTGPGIKTLDNTGTFEMRPVVVIYGPCTNPGVTNTSLANTPTLQFSNPTQVGYTLKTGEKLVVDLDYQSITLTSGTPDTPTTNLGSAVPNWLVTGSVWWDLPPGKNVVQFFSDDTSAVAGYAEVWWAPAYASAT